MVLGRLALGETIPVRVATDDRSRVVVDEHALLGTPPDEVGYRVKAKPGAVTMADVIARGASATLRLRKVSNPGMRTPDGRDPVLVLHLEVLVPGSKPYRVRVGQRTPETALTHVVAGAEFPGTRAARQPAPRRRRLGRRRPRVTGVGRSDLPVVVADAALAADEDVVAAIAAGEDADLAAVRDRR